MVFSLWSGQSVRGGERQVEREGGALSRAALDVDLAAVGGDDLAGDGQPEAQRLAWRRGPARGRTSRRRGRGARPGCPRRCRPRRSARCGRRPRRRPRRGCGRPRRCAPGRCRPGCRRRARSARGPPAPAAGRTPQRRSSSIPASRARASNRSMASATRSAGATGWRSSWTRPCSIRVRSSRSLIIASSRSESCRAASSSSTCLALSGPTTSSSSRWTAIWMLVSGVFSSWLTVETMSLLSWSTRRNLVTSVRTTAAPSRPSAASSDGQHVRQEEALLAVVAQAEGVVQARRCRTVGRPPRTSAERGSQQPRAAPRAWRWPRRSRRGAGAPPGWPARRRRSGRPPRPGRGTSRSSPAPSSAPVPAGRSRPGGTRGSSGPWSLNAAASSPSSSCVVAGTTWSRSPRAIARVARGHGADRLEDRTAQRHGDQRGDDRRDQQGDHHQPDRRGGRLARRGRSRPPCSAGSGRAPRRPGA